MSSGSGIVSNCVNRGNVTAISVNSIGEAGGIAGSVDSNGAVYNCGSTGCIDGGSDLRGYVGGIAGYTSGPLENCWFAGTTGFAFKAAGIALVSESLKPAADGDQAAPVKYSYSSYGTVALVFDYKSSSAISAITSDEDVSGCGKFYPYDVESAAAQTVVWTDQTGAEVREGQHPYLLSRRTDLVTALNGWAADQDGDYDFWALDAQNLPARVQGSWADRAQSPSASGDTVTVSSAEELAGLAEAVNGGDSFAGKTVRLSDHIDLSSAYWTPIGNETTPFAGTFDGDGHILSGLYGPEGGLFGNLEGTVKNLLLAKGYVGAGDSAAACAGNGTVINCGSTCEGAAGTLSGMDCTYRNCWDSETHPAVETLNRLGQGYNRWYEVPNSTDYAFSPSYVTIAYNLDGGTLADAPERCVYGNDLAGIGTPERTGYDFAGWKVYRVGAEKPIAVCVYQLTREVVGDATELSLEALWTDSGKTLLDYCQLIDGIYVLQQDVVLTAGVEVPAGQRLFLDTNGYDISAHAETALFHVTGGTLILFNRSTTDNSTLVCNAAVFQKDSGQLSASYYAESSGQTILQSGAVDENEKIVLREAYIAPVNVTVGFYLFRIDTDDNVLRLKPCNGEFSADLLPGETHYRYVRSVHLTPAELETYLPNDWLALEAGDRAAVVQYSAGGRMLEAALLGSSDIFVMDGIGCQADMDRAVVLRLSGTDFRPLAAPLAPRPDAGDTASEAS